ncbi:MAG TPA: HEAT repeat domain-containing protein [Nitrospiraceae bacterium]|nr:HEAT repeat domain-containing protein [Nitrospiraceae bacterium]
MKMRIGLILIVLVWLCADNSFARRESFTAEQKEKLGKIERVLVEVLAITDKGSQDPGPLSDTVVKRIQSLGYTVVTDPAQPHDVVLRVKCEQQKVWEGVSRSGSDADQPDSPLRVWKGPACQILYLLDGKKMGWHKEVRTDFQDARQAAAAAQGGDPGAYALARLNERLQQYSFPIFLAAEWGQEERLLKALDDPATESAEKVKIINLLGEIFAIEAVPRLITALKDPDTNIAKAAAVALGNIGNKQGITALTDVLKTGQPELQAAAAKGLGQAGALHGDFSIIPPLLDALKTDDLTVKTEVVWALGKLPDKRTAEVLYALNRSLPNTRGTEQETQEKKLREAINWSLKQVDTFDQGHGN